MRLRPGSTAEPSETADDPLEKYKDGRLWRLKRGRDFTTVPRAFQKSLRRLAAAEGRTVRTVRDRYHPDKYLWVQFGAGRLVPGLPCPVCGSDSIARTHPVWARCTTCRAMLELVDSDVLAPAADSSLTNDEPANSEDEPLADPAGARHPLPNELDAYAEVHLRRIEGLSKRELYAGWGRTDEGDLALLTVEFPRDQGRRIVDPEDPGRWLQIVHAVLYAPFADGLDVDELDAVPTESWLAAVGATVPAP